MSRPHRYRAPETDFGLLADPPAEVARATFDTESARLDSSPLVFGGLPLAELRRLARGEAVDAARTYLRDAGEPVPEVPSAGLLVAGHQPELFHPGVWAKNFALTGRARRAHRVPLNLVVDNDTVKSLALTLPTGPMDAARLTRIPFDGGPAEVPWEERGVSDPAIFHATPDAVAEATRDWPFRPLAGALWAAMPADGRLGERLVAGRRALERRWGCHNLELPVSRLAETTSFARFAAGLLADLPRLHAAYNQCLADYRRAHGLRSRSHPVPDLARDGDAHEVPLWAWSTGEMRRGRLFARAESAGTTLLLAGREVARLPPPTRGDDFAAAWATLQPLKVRPRALMTTLFARLCLADGFLHGIGGGKYDELTDAVAVRLFEVQPAAYAVLSATIRLPLPAPAITPSERLRLARVARDALWNPQRHLDAAATPEVASLVARHDDEVRSEPATRRGRRQRYRQLRYLTESLRPFAAGRAEAAARELATADAALASAAVLRRRDFSFALFPEELLRPFLAGLSADGT